MIEYADSPAPPLPLNLTFYNISDNDDIEGRDIDFDVEEDEEEDESEEGEREAIDRREEEEHPNETETQTETANERDSIEGGGEKVESAPSHEPQGMDMDRVRSYWITAEFLRAKLPQVTSDEDDPVRLKDDKDMMETRCLYLICHELYLSAYSYNPAAGRELFEINFALGVVTHEFTIYQRHFPHTPSHLSEWYEEACEAFERALASASDLHSADKSGNTLCSWAGVIRDYANSGVSGVEKTDHLFRLAYEKYQEAMSLYGNSRPDYLLLENWAYAIREHANFNVRIKNHAESRRRFNECFLKYEECNALHSDSIVLSNWADALREKAEIEDGQERKRLFKLAHGKYKLSFAQDQQDCLTLCNWAMLYCLRARTSHATARALRRLTGQGGDGDSVILDQAVEAEAEYRRLVATGKAKLEHGLLQSDLWTYFCMARLCAAAGEVEECRQWLDKCASKRYLSKVKESQRADFENVKDLEWFIEMQRQQLEEQQHPSRD